MTELIWDGKYKDGKKVAPPRIELPFQDVETVNESVQTRQMVLDLYARNQPGEWHNRLIWGDKKYVLPSLLSEFAGKVDLIYIDPPFATGADFSYTARVPDDPGTEGDQSASFLKQPSMLEQKAYRDTWGRGLDSYLQWFYETAVLMHELLADDGSLYVHLDWHVGYYGKQVLDEVLGLDNFVAEVVWHYGLGNARSVNQFPRKHDNIFLYGKSENRKFNVLRGGITPAMEAKYSHDDEIGRYMMSYGKKYYLKGGKVIDSVWSDIATISPTGGERTTYPTQKPEALLERIIQASSDVGDLVLDCFCGSGTTAAVAEKLGRRWIASDLGKFAIHTTRKRLLSIPDVRPFVVQNLGRYERQAWRAAEFGEDEEQAALARARYRRFILDLYGAQPLDGYNWLHGVRAGRMVHVGSVDSPVVEADVKGIAREFWRVVGKGAGATVNSVDVLGWDFAFELNEMGKQMAADANIGMAFKRIPRDVMDKRAVEQGDVQFFELAALDVAVVPEPGRTVCVELCNFIVSPDDVPMDVQRAITHWSQWIDYWAIDWDYKGDTFHNQWQSYRTKKNPKLELSAVNTYAFAGEHTVVIKVIDILGNDTTKSVRVEVQ